MTNNWRSKRTFLSLSLSDNQTNKLQNIIIHNMNNIQVSLKADNQNGILSIQGVDLFSIIDTTGTGTIFHSYKSAINEYF